MGKCCVAAGVVIESDSSATEWGGELLFVEKFASLRLTIDQCVLGLRVALTESAYLPRCACSMVGLQREKHVGLGAYGRNL